MAREQGSRPSSGSNKDARGQHVASVGAKAQPHTVLSRRQAADATEAAGDSNTEAAGDSKPALPPKGR